MLKKEYLIYKLSEAAREACKIDNELFPMYNVKRGLRNEDGSGVLVGLTQVGNVVGYERLPEGGLKAIPGKLFYRGYDVEDLARDFIKEKRFGFEEVAYLLLSGIHLQYATSQYIHDVLSFQIQNIHLGLLLQGHIIVQQFFKG